LTATRKSDRRVFFLVAWLFPKQQQSVQGVLEEVQNVYEPRWEELAKQHQLLLEQLTQMSMHVQSWQQEERHAFITEITREITGHLDAVYAPKVGALEESYRRVSAELSGLLSDDHLVESGDETSAIAPYSEDLQNDIRGLLIGYPILSRWLSTGQRSVTIEEIIEVTNHTRKMVVNRVNDGTFVKTRRAGSYRVDSVVKWLKSAPLPKSHRETSMRGEVVKAGSNGHGKVMNQDDWKLVTEE